MALTWNWNERIGTAYFKSNDKNRKDFSVSLYKGNAFLIMLNEFKEDGKDMYNMFSFFVDETHMKRCLGLYKNYSNNLFDNEDYTLTKIDIDKGYVYLDKLCKALVKSLNAVDINIGQFEGTYEVAS